MAQQASSKRYRNGNSIMDIFKLFPDDATAEAWFVGTRWPTGVCCVESFWSMFKRANKGTFHNPSPEYLDRDVQELATRYNVRELNALAQLAALARGMVDKRLRNPDLIACAIKPQ